MDNQFNDDNDFKQFMCYFTLSSLCLIALIAIIAIGRKLQIGQKTRSQQQRRAFTGSRPRTSLSQSEPTIYVSPANLPPPPKYEAMAPPSYDEAVGIHYPQYQIPVQPITRPITTALTQNSNSTAVNANAENASPSRNEAETSPSTVITVTTDESRTSVRVASS